MLPERPRGPSGATRLGRVTAAARRGYVCPVAHLRFILLGFLIGATTGTVASCGTSNCKPYTCPDGCCDSSDRCVKGTAATACGRGGNLCSVCDRGLVCAKQACASPAGSGGGGGDLGQGGGGGGGVELVTATVTGTVTYDFVPSVVTGLGTAAETATLDFAQASARPVRGGVVRVVQGGNTLAEGLTSMDGGFSLTYTTQAAGRMTLYALAKTQTPPIQIDDNTAQDSVWALGGSLSGHDEAVKLHAAHGWVTGAGYDVSKRAAGPFAILDSMYTASQAVLATRPSLALPLLKCHWSPKNTTQDGDVSLGHIGTSYFSPQENEIYILGKEGVDTDEFDAHVIVHEWGHFFEQNLGRSDSPGGNHGTGDELDARLALSEGWGDALGAMVLPETTYSDTLWVGAEATGSGFDAEAAPTNTDDPSPSVFSEASVMRFLYDVYDGKNEPHDAVSAGLGPILDVLTGPLRTTEALTTLAPFVTALREHAAVEPQGAALDGLLANYGIPALSSPWGAPDARLEATYTTLGALPAQGTTTLTGFHRFNTVFQNHAFVFPGNGKAVTVAATTTDLTRNLAITVFQTGVVLGRADALSTGGVESLTISTTTGYRYVLVVTGFSPEPGGYEVTVSIK